jgi:hypothetical protein
VQGNPCPATREQFDPKEITEMSEAVIRKNSLSPFGPSDPERQDWLVKEMIQGIVDLDIEGDVYALETCEGFRAEMLDNIDPDLKSMNVLTKLLGQGDWSTWPWTVGQVVRGLTTRARMRKMLASFGSEALQVYDELGELNQKLKPFRQS